MVKKSLVHERKNTGPNGCDYTNTPDCNSHHIRYVVGLKRPSLPKLGRMLDDDHDCFCYLTSGS